MYYYVPLPSGDLVEVVYRVELGDMLVAALLLFLVTWLVGSWLWELIVGVLR